MWKGIDRDTIIFVIYVCFISILMKKNKTMFTFSHRKLGPNNWMETQEMVRYYIN